MSLGYDIIYAAGLLVGSPYLLYWLCCGGKKRSDWPARFGKVTGFPAKKQGSKTVLIHAVSVGEVNAAAGLVRELHAQRPDLRIIVSVTTDTGIARARDLFADRFEVVRYPLDLGFSVQRFLDVVQPDAVGLIELEVWPNFVRECASRGVPVCVLNGRLSARSFARYRWGRTLLRPTFSRLALAAAQTQDYADRFVALGTPADRVIVADSLKWDGTKIVEPGGVPGADALAQAIGLDRSRPVIVAGSTGPGEEKLLIDTCPAEAQLVLVPRKPERFDEVAALAPMVRRSHYPDGTSRPIDDTGVFLLDTMGELNKAYALADVAIVGRSFCGLHGSNPIEPIALGRPTIIGPDHSDFADMVAAFQSAGGILVTREPGPAAADLLASPDKARTLAARGVEVIRSRQGVTAKQAQLFLNVLNSHAPA